MVLIINDDYFSYHPSNTFKSKWKKRESSFSIINDDIDNYKDIIIKMRIFCDLSTNKFVNNVKTSTFGRFRNVWYNVEIDLRWSKPAVARVNSQFVHLLDYSV